MSAAEPRFEFGENWRRFLSTLSEERIASAESSLREMLGVADLSGRKFLDVGSGSGLFSLAARRLGAAVRSFDFDPQSVECSALLKSRYFPADPSWIVERGSILDTDYIDSLGPFDVVYAWGVLHHTGDLPRALENAARAASKPGSRLFVSIYNDQGWVSGYWKLVKALSNRGAFLRRAMLALHAPYVAARWIARAATGRGGPGRGMSLWYDLKDWLGGYPFEVARPDEISGFYRARGFELEKSKACGRRHGCNEFVFVKTPQRTR